MCQHIHLKKVADMRHDTYECVDCKQLFAAGPYVQATVIYPTQSKESNDAK